MNICLLGYRSNPFSGGQGVYLTYLSRALVDAGHHVDVISGPPYPELDSRVSLIKLPSLDLYAEGQGIRRFKWRYLRSITDTFEYFSTISGGFPEPYTFGRRLIDFFDQTQPRYDVVHDNQCLSYGTFELQARGIPLVTTIHHPITRDLEIALAAADSWGLRLLIRRWHSFLTMQKKVVKKLKHLVTVSYAARDDIRAAFQLGEHPIEVIHNGIDLDQFRPMGARDDHRLQTSPPIIMSTASADAPLKGLDTLLNAFAIVLAEHPNARLRLIGALKPGGETEQKIQSLGIKHAIEALGRVDTENMVSLYQSATVAVVPSVYEGFGFPAGEAMACGVPLISTDGGALPEVVGDAGLIVPAQDPRAMARAISGLLNDPNRRTELSRTGVVRIHEQFNWRRAADAYVSLYQKAIEQSRCL